VAPGGDRVRGPPTHTLLLRQLCVGRREWIQAEEFEDAIAACNLLPGPSSTQLAIFCAGRVGGWPGALVGGAGFIVPGLIVIIALAALFLSSSPPGWVRAGAGGGAAVAAVAVRAALDLAPPSWRRAGGGARHLRWVAYVAAGFAASALAGSSVVLALVGCGGLEVLIRVGRTGPISLAAAPHAAGLGSLAWTRRLVALRPSARERDGTRLPRGRRPGGDRCDRGVIRAPRRRAAGGLAVRRARRCGGGVAPRAAQHRRRAAGGRRRRRAGARRRRAHSGVRGGLGSSTSRPDPPWFGSRRRLNSGANVPSEVVYLAVSELDPWVPVGVARDLGATEGAPWRIARLLVGLNRRREQELPRAPACVGGSSP